MAKYMSNSSILRPIKGCRASPFIVDSAALPHLCFSIFYTHRSTTIHDVNSSLPAHTDTAAVLVCTFPLLFNMALVSALYHEGKAAEKAGAARREAKYGGEQKPDTMVDLCEPSIPGVLMKKIVRPGNGEMAPVGVNVSEQLVAEVEIVYFCSYVKRVVA